MEGRKVLFVGLLLVSVLVSLAIMGTYKRSYHSSLTVPARETYNTNDFKSSYQYQDASKSKALSYAKIIIVIAYYRTGSTLTGSLLQEHPVTFYVFEPIRNVYNMMHSNNNETHFTLKYLTGQKKWLKSNKDVIQNEIKSLLQCKLTSLSFQSLSDAGFRAYSKALRQFSSCFRLKVQNETQLDSCFQSGVSACNNSTAIVLKLIREEMEDIEKFLPYFPNMKIIHLIGDPRGMLTSQKRVDTRVHDTNEYIKEQCCLIERNLNSTRSLFKTYPGRIRLQRYEDLAEFPMSSAKDIYKFAGFPFKKNVQQFIKLNTAGGGDSGSFSVRRNDSTKTASKWRTSIEFDKSEYIYEQCRTSMNILGYLPFESNSELRNMTLKSRDLTNATVKLLSESNT